MLGALTASVRPPTICALIALCGCHHHRDHDFFDDGFHVEGVRDSDDDEEPIPSRHLPAMAIEPEPGLAVAWLATDPAETVMGVSRSRAP